MLQKTDFMRRFIISTVVTGKANTTKQYLYQLQYLLIFFKKFFSLIYTFVLVNMAKMKIMLVPMMLLLLLLEASVPVMSMMGSVQVINYRKLRSTQNGPERCALDKANMTMSYPLKHCSFVCGRDGTCTGFNIKDSLTCDHVMSPVLASTSRTLSPVICTTINRGSAHLPQPARSTRLVLFLR